MKNITLNLPSVEVLRQPLPEPPLRCAVSQVALPQAIRLHSWDTFDSLAKSTPERPGAFLQK